MPATFLLPPLLQSAPVAIASVDLLGVVLDVNRALIDASGYTGDEIRGQPFLAFLGPGDEAAARASFAALARGELDSYRTERRYRTRSGVVRNVDVSVSLVRDGEGAPEMCLAVLQDVTAHKEALEHAVRADDKRREAAESLQRLLVETRRAHDEIESASRVKDEFLATLSHELRTPLNAILGWTRILRGREFDASTTRALDVIERNAASQARLIDDLLDMSRIITGKIRLQMETVETSAIAASALESVKPTADAKGVRLQAHLPATLPSLTGDAQRLQQVLWNLLSNAVKFTDAGGRVTLEIETDARTLQITVSDTGSGIPPAILPFVFDRFTQADSSSTRQHAGLGLGLAIVRHLVELHGGRVAAESEGEGRGARFHVWLPLPI